MIAALLLAGLLGVVAPPPAAEPVPTPQHLPTVTLAAPAAPLTVQVAATPAQRERGLMGVTALAPRSGMLFVFPMESTWEFWMKDTPLDLDMVWLRRSGTVSSVAARVPHAAPRTPDERIARRQGYGAYVIELSAGEAARDGLAPGARVGGLPPLAEH